MISVHVLAVALEGDGVDRGLGDAEDRGDAAGDGRGPEVGVLRLERDGQGRAALGDVVRQGRAVVEDLIAHGAQGGDDVGDEGLVRADGNQQREHRGHQAE